MSGVGVNILDVEVHTCTDCSDDEAFKEMMSEQSADIGEGRVIRLRLQVRLNLQRACTTHGRCRSPSLASSLNKQTRMQAPTCASASDVQFQRLHMP